MAQMPATSPGPKMATKSRAHTMVLTERVATRINRPSHHRSGWGVVLRAAMNATGTAISTDKHVAMMAMLIVSKSDWSTRGSTAQSGGYMRWNWSRICAGASHAQGQWMSTRTSAQLTTSTAARYARKRPRRWARV